jgi:alkylhydroperoxidase family enzyme
MGRGDSKATHTPTTTVQSDPHAAKMERLVKAVLEGSGTLDQSVRQALARRGDVPDALRSYLDKVARHAYKVTDEDVEALRAAGYSEDQIFEATVSCALGACLRRLEVGLRTIEGDA